MQFGGLSALNNVSVAVPRGQIRAVIGPNGAGKSTFFNCLTGVLRPTGGRIVFDDEDIAGLPPDRISRKAIARSYQITNILPGATVLENVRIAAQSRHHAWSLVSSPPRLRGHHRAGAGGAGGGGAPRQGSRAGRQSLARRAAEPRDRHRPGHRAQAALPRRADRRHERGRDPSDGRADPAHRQGPHHHDRGARHGGGDGPGPRRHRAPLRRGPGRGLARPRSRPIHACRRSTSRPDAPAGQRPYLLRQIAHPPRRVHGSPDRGGRRPARAQWRGKVDDTQDHHRDRAALRGQHRVRGPGHRRARPPTIWRAKASPGFPRTVGSSGCSPSTRTCASGSTAAG